jgi:hypothetical protein
MCRLGPGESKRRCRRALLCPPPPLRRKGKMHQEGSHVLKTWPRLGCAKAGWQVGAVTGRTASWQAHRLEVGRLAGWQAGRLAGWQAGRLAGWQAGRLAGWQAGRLAGWQAHRLAVAVEAASRQRSRAAQKARSEALPPQRRRRSGDGARGGGLCRRLRRARARGKRWQARLRLQQSREHAGRQQALW